MSTILEDALNEIGFIKVNDGVCGIWILDKEIYKDLSIKITITPNVENVFTKVNIDWMDNKGKTNSEEFMDYNIFLTFSEIVNFFKNRRKSEDYIREIFERALGLIELKVI